jgi:hypothetical protein
MTDQVRIFLTGDCGIVRVGQQDLIEEPPRIPGGHSEHPEAKVNDIDTAAFVEVPSVSRSHRLVAISPSRSESSKSRRVDLAGPVSRAMRETLVASLANAERSSGGWMTVRCAPNRSSQRAIAS